MPGIPAVALGAGGGFVSKGLEILLGCRSSLLSGLGAEEEMGRGEDSLTTS